MFDGGHIGVPQNQFLQRLDPLQSDDTIIGELRAGLKI
jgi:hypothetical protein